jgi:3-mercaptopyruvate sulfurtransferase SseA
MCYDSSTGKFAARVACLLSSIGVKDVMILDGKNYCPKSETKLTASKPPGGNVFSFKK